MKEDPSKFVNFQHVVVWDTALVVCLAGLVAIGCIRLLKLAGYSKKTMRVYRVLKLSTGHLPGFFIYIYLILTGFACLGMMWFGKTSHYYRNFLSCMENLFTGVLGNTGFKVGLDGDIIFRIDDTKKKDWGRQCSFRNLNNQNSSSLQETGLPEPERVLTITYFILFSSVVVHLLSNFFVAILSDLLTVNAQRNCDEVQGDNAKIFSVMWDSFLRLLGRKRDPLERLRKKSG
ncbi:polycystic kidney disease 2-like 1 protein [Elysia marginata]|uniref:Polycystic kidney disease 2-like 1 protein n=1 Tax=Elysia marginata TaxID=1093978 RepID=A0AAV4FUH8_9GAST|nr:polycystic kidney disease 2-like 1 protein [Elysia marginata]